MGKIRVCVNGVGVMLCWSETVCVCSGVGQPRLRCQRTVQLSYLDMLLNTLMSGTHTPTRHFDRTQHYLT